MTERTQLQQLQLIERLETRIAELETENEGHRKAQAAVYAALGPNADTDRDTWPEQIRRLRARLDRVGHRVVPPGWSGPAEDY